MGDRVCGKAQCSRSATATLSYDYPGSLIVIGPLSLERQPGFHDLCQHHVDGLTAPVGWRMIRYSPLPG